MVFVLFVLWFTTSGYSLWLLWSLLWLSSDLPLLVTPFDSYGLCFVCPLIDHFWLLPLTLMVFVLIVLWPLLVTSFDSCGLCFVCPLIYHFWLLPLTLVIFVLFVLWFTTSGYFLWLLWSLFCLSSELPLLVTSFDSCGLCFVCPLIYHFWLLPLTLMVFVLFVLWFTTSGYFLWLLWSLFWLSSDLPLLVAPSDSCGLCFVCPLKYHFWLLPLTLVVFVLFVLWLTTSGYSLWLLWSLFCLSSKLPLLVTSFDSCGLCFVCPLIYHFWLLPLTLVVFVLIVLWFTTSGCSLWLLWSLFCLSSDLPLLVTSFDSCGLCFVCPLSYHFWLLPLTLVVFVLFVLWFTTSGYSLWLLWSLFCLSSDLPLLVTSFDSCGLCFDCPLTYHFWLLPLTLVVFVLFVLWNTTSGYFLWLLWSLFCLSSDLPLLVTPFDSYGLCFVCPLNYHFWLLPLTLVVFVLFVLWFTTSGYFLWLLWSLFWLSSDLPLLVAPFDSCGLCFVCPLIYHFWLLPLTLVVFVLFVLWITTSGYSLWLLWFLFCLSSDWSLLVTPFDSYGLCFDCPLIDHFWLLPLTLAVFVLFVLWLTTSGYSLWLLWFLFWLSSDLPLLVTPFDSYGLCFVCPLIYHFRLLPLTLVVFVLFVLWLTTSGYFLWLLWSLFWLSSDWPLLVTPFDSFGLCFVCPLIYHFWLLPLTLVVFVLIVLWLTTSGYYLWLLWSLFCLSSDLPLLVTPFDSYGFCFDWPLLVTPVDSYGLCFVCPLIYHFWLLPLTLVVFVLFLLWITTSGYFLWLLWSLFWLSSELPLLVTPFDCDGLCFVCPLNYHFWLLPLTLVVFCFVCPLTYHFWLLPLTLMVFVLFVLWLITSGYSLWLLWSLFWLSSDWPLLVTPFESCGLCFVCPLIDHFWLLPLTLMVFVLIVLWFTTSGYSLWLLWSLFCLSSDLPLPVTPFDSCGLCFVCPLIDHFWLLPLTLMVFVLFVLWLTTSGYPFDSFGLCFVCPLIYHFWLLPLTLVVFVLIVLWLTTSGYYLWLLWSLFCLSSDLPLLVTPFDSYGFCFDWPLLVTPVDSYGLCFVCPLIYHFWLLPLTLVVFVLFLLWFTTSGYFLWLLWSLFWLSSELSLLVTPFDCDGLCFVCPLNYHFWLLPLTLVVFCFVCPLTYHFWLLPLTLMVFVLFVLWLTTSGYSLWLLWSLFCLSSDWPLLVTPFDSYGFCFDWPLLVTPVDSYGLCFVCPLIYHFWLLPLTLVVFVLFLLWFTTSGYFLWLLWSLFWLSSELPLLVTPFDCDGLCFVCPLNYHFWLLPLTLVVFCFVCPLTYHFWLLPLTLMVFVLFVLWLTTSGYSLWLLWSLFCLSSDWPLLVTPFDSYGLCFVCPLIDHFWLLPLTLMVFVLFVLWFTTSGYSLWLFWSLFCLSSDLPLLVTSFDSCDLCFVSPLIYHFWLLPLTFVSSNFSYPYLEWL